MLPQILNNLRGLNLGTKIEIMCKPAGTHIPLQFMNKNITLFPQILLLNTCKVKQIKLLLPANFKVRIHLIFWNLHSKRSVIHKPE